MKENLSNQKTSSLEDVLNLKKATNADIAVLLELEKSVSGVNTYSAMMEECEWEETLQSGPVYLIEIDGVVAGYISYEKKDNDNAYLSGLVVIPCFRGRGIARESLSRVLNELQGFRRIDLVTHPDNKVAVGLYQSFGFVAESQKENYFGDGEPRLILVKMNSKT